MSSRGLVALCLTLVLWAQAVWAGGPLLIFDGATRTPYSYPPGDVDVFTDLGSMGPLTNAESDVLTQNVGSLP